MPNRHQNIFRFAVTTSLLQAEKVPKPNLAKSTSLLVSRIKKHVDQAESSSHNVVIRNRRIFTSYGNFVMGQGNNITGPKSFISCGKENVASGKYSSVNIDFNNIVLGNYSSFTTGIDSNRQ